MSTDENWKCSQCGNVYSIKYTPAEHAAMCLPVATPPTPGAPAAATKLTTNRRERQILQCIIAAGGWLAADMLPKGKRELCDKRTDLYRRENYGGRPGYAATNAGRAAIDHATPDGGAK